MTVQVYLLISWKILSTHSAFLQHGFVGFLGERERAIHMGVENSLVITKAFVR
jgi:hypothetical protein